MLRAIKKVISPTLRKKLGWIKKKLIDCDAIKSYSQEGEDLVLARIFGTIKVTSKFFVDIGAHHPTRFSNTYYFYRQGWQGINVDAMPGTKKIFERMRPRDITVECGVGAQESVLKYFVFNEPALNTFSEQEVQKKNIPPYHVVETLLIPVVTLKQILDEHLPSGTRIDFLTIDAEGFDYEVIASNDWNRYRPRVILIELLNTGIENLKANPIAQLLHSQNYRAFSKTYNTFFFVANEAIPQKTPL